MHRRAVLSAGSLVVVTSLGGCLSRITGDESAAFRPAVEAFNRGLDTFGRAQSTRTTARTRYEAGEWDAAARRYTAARDGFDAAASEFDTARDATTGDCPAVHDRAVRQYRRSLALVEACGFWTEAATARLADADADRSEERAGVWDGRAAEYPSASRFDPEAFSCRL